MIEIATVFLEERILKYKGLESASRSSTDRAGVDAKAEKGIGP